VAPLPESVVKRLTTLVIGQGQSIDAARRLMAAGTDGPAVTVSRNGADRAIRTARQAIESGADIPAVAARILRLLSLELSALERDTGPRDLDRLHKLAQTLSSVERLRPKTGETREHGLLSLQEEDTQPQNGQP
jgi:hypothetical protein